MNRNQYAYLINELNEAYDTKQDILYRFPRLVNAVHYIVHLMAISGPQVPPSEDEPGEPQPAPPIGTPLPIEGDE